MGNSNSKMAGPSKMMIMMPLMYLARKNLDQNDMELVFKLRIAYGTIQAIVISLVAFLYFQVKAFRKTKEGKKIVFVEKNPEPFGADPNAKKKYMEVEFGAHMEKTLTSFIGSTAFGIAIQLGLHVYNGMIASFAVQLIMAPLGLMENNVTRFFILDQKDVFATKTREELSTEDEIVDDEGKPIVPNKTGMVVSKKDEKKEAKNFEDILLDTWDGGQEADVKPLMGALTKENVNYKTKESEWTPLMILSGLGVKNTKESLKKMKELGADASIRDQEGWTALHWSAFHGCAEAADFVLSASGFNGSADGLIDVKCKEGKTALEHAEAEKNKDVSMIIKQYVSSKLTENSPTESEGLRKRK